MEPTKDQFMGDDNETNPALSRPVSAYPLWKRGFAVIYVLFLCLVTAVIGAIAAGVFGAVTGVSSFSGY